MAGRKKANKSSPVEDYRGTVRLNPSDAEHIRLAAEWDGYDSIPAWLIHLGQTRAAAIQQAQKTGEYVEIQGRRYLHSELPPELANAVRKVKSPPSA